MLTPTDAGTTPDGTPIRVGVMGLGSDGVLTTCNCCSDDPTRRRRRLRAGTGGLRDRGRDVPRPRAELPPNQPDWRRFLVEGGQARSMRS